MIAILWGVFLAALFAGLPVAFAMGALALVMAFFVMGTPGYGLVIYRIFSLSYEFVLVAVPLFIFMGSMLERSGAADALYEGMHHLFGPMRGGLAIGTVVVCVFMAAMTGIVGAATVSMTLIALPAMLKRHYDKSLALGCIAGGGTLGVLIPPSIPMVIIGLSGQISIGKLFAGGIIPGLLMASLFIIYIAIRSALQPHIAPALPNEERTHFVKKLSFVSRMLPAFLLIFGVLGSIFFGVATPTEAAAVGALGSVLIAAQFHRLKWPNIRSACYATARTTAMVMWILIASQAFSAVFTAMGGPKMIVDWLLGLSANRWGVVIVIQVVLFILGMLMDQVSIIWIFIPVFLPVIMALGFDPIWFGVLFTVQVEMAYLTPPFGYTLFYMKGIAPPDITMGDIYRGVTPFVLLEILGLVILMVWPPLITWLPSVISR